MLEDQAIIAPYDRCSDGPERAEPLEACRFDHTLTPLSPIVTIHGEQDCQYISYRFCFSTQSTDFLFTLCSVWPLRVPI